MSNNLNTKKIITSERQFCEENGIPPSTYYMLKKKGKGPKITKIGRRNYLTEENGQAWIKSLTEI